MKTTMYNPLTQVIFLILAVGTVAANAADNTLPRLPEPYVGTLAPTEAQSTAMFPTPSKAPAGAPNILLVMTDDAGFGATSTFGGAVPTPNLDKLAARGLRYNRFHTVGVCSPTRAALLTGRNHHAVGMGSLVEINSPYPGYTGKIPSSAAPVARILRDNGYSTAMFGKDHNVPSADRTIAGPFDQWPIGRLRGFEYFYGFIGGDTNQWHPSLYEGTLPVDGSNRPEGYLLDADLADKAIKWIHNQKAAAPDKPFFMYYAPGSTHAPHQAPKEWIAKFKGRFDHGWDKERELIFARQLALGIVPEGTQLTPRPDTIPAWDSLSAVEQKVFARFMEVFAAQLAYQDAQFGRIMDELDRMQLADNTLVIFIEGDNGSSAEGASTGTVNELADLASSGGHDIDIPWLAENLEVLGGPETFQGFQAGWAYATNAPFPWFKQLASHLGGVRNGMVVSWPARIKEQGELRPQYHHVIDIFPTLLDVVGLSAPDSVDGVAQQAIDGVSMTYSFDNANRPSLRRTQYYEVHGNRAIYHEGWLASTTPRNMPWELSENRNNGDITTYEWELYNLDEDFSQAHNLVKENPEKLKELQAVFDTEARRNNVYPVQDSDLVTRTVRMMQHSSEPLRTEYIFWGGDIQIPSLSAPPIFYMPFSIEAEVVIPENGGEGVILAAGSFFGGWSFYLRDGKPVAYAAVSPFQNRQYSVASDTKVSPGPHLIRFDFKPAGKGGQVSIVVDGKPVAKGSVKEWPHTLAGNGETFDIGWDTNDYVSPDYRTPGIFNGEIKKVAVKVEQPQRGTAH